MNFNARGWGGKETLGVTPNTTGENACNGVLRNLGHLVTLSLGGKQNMLVTTETNSVENRENCSIAWDIFRVVL